MCMELKMWTPVLCKCHKLNSESSVCNKWAKCCWTHCSLLRQTILLVNRANNACQIRGRASLNTACPFTFALLLLYTVRLYGSDKHFGTGSTVEAVREGPLYGLRPTLINWQTHIDPAAPQPCTPPLAETTCLHSNREKHHVFIICKTFFDIDHSLYATLNLTISCHVSCVLVWLLFIVHPHVYSTNHTYVHNRSVSNTMCKL